jgi:hypothetical protein
VRQHRDDAIRQVHRHAAQGRLAIERVVPAHVVRDVGDRDPHPGAAVGAVLDAQRVVEVARGLGIDRAEAAIAQVDAVGVIGGADLLRGGLGLGQRGRRELERHRGDREDLRDLGARIVGIAEDLQHARRQLVATGLGVAGDLDDHRLAVVRGRAAVERDLAEIGGDPRIVGLEEDPAPAGAQHAGQAGAPARQHLDDAALDALDADPGRDLDLIAVERAGPVLGRHEHVAAVGQPDEAVAGGVHGDAPGRGVVDGGRRRARPRAGWSRRRGGGRRGGAGAAAGAGGGRRRRCRGVGRGWRGGWRGGLAPRQRGPGLLVDAAAVGRQRVGAAGELAHDALLDQRAQQLAHVRVVALARADRVGQRRELDAAGDGGAEAVEDVVALDGHERRAWE